LSTSPLLTADETNLNLKTTWGIPDLGHLLGGLDNPHTTRTLGDLEGGVFSTLYTETKKLTHGRSAHDVGHLPLPFQTDDPEGQEHEDDSVHSNLAILTVTVGNLNLKSTSATAQDREP